MTFPLFLPFSLLPVFFLSSFCVLSVFFLCSFCVLSVFFLCFFCLLSVFSLSSFYLLSVFFLSFPLFFAGIYTFLISTCEQVNFDFVLFQVRKFFFCIKVVGVKAKMSRFNRILSWLWIFILFHICFV